MMTRYENGEWNTYFYLRDHLGSVTGIVDYAGNIVETYSYSPYGEPSLFDNEGGGISVSLAGNRFMYTGREYDLETGLYYYRFRYYDPESHRFLSIDPIHIAGGLNVYGYVAANPQMLTDPFGFTPLLLDKNFWGAFPGEMLRTTGQLGVSFINLPLAPFSKAAYRRTVNNSLNGQITKLDPKAKTERTIIWGCLAVSATAISGAIGVNAAGIGHYEVIWKGGEIVFSDTTRLSHVVRFRFCPFGHWFKGAEWYQRIVHYHRRASGGIGRHRPWETIIKLFK